MDKQPFMSDLLNMLEQRYGVKPFKIWILLIVLLAERKEGEIERQQRKLKYLEWRLT